MDDLNKDLVNDPNLLEAIKEEYLLYYFKKYRNQIKVSERKKMENILWILSIAYIAVLLTTIVLYVRKEERNTKTIWSKNQCLKRNHKKQWCK